MRGFCLIAVAACLSVMASAQTTADELIQAIRNNDLASLKARLAKGAQVNTRAQRGSTLLMHAAAFGSPEAVKLLLGSGADVNAKNDLEATALMLGAGNPEKARMLVEKGADVNAHSKLGRTPLMIAAGCDGCSATAKLTAENQLEVVPAPFPGMPPMARAGIANLTIWHSFDHYGQMAVYARMNGVIPPASAPRPAAPQGKKEK